MARSVEEEQAYLRARSAAHGRQAEDAATPADRALHERFAAIYEARAAALQVQED